MTKTKNAAKTQRTTKATAAPKTESVREVAPASLAVDGRIVVKVLKGNRSWNNGTFSWDLPTQNADGTWTPGAWTPKVDIDYCRSGYHGTNCAPKWWGEGVTAWWMEYHPDAKIITPDQGGPSGEGNKFCGEQCRLVRPLTRGELESQGVYLTGTHASVGEDGKFYVLGGDVKVETLSGGTVTYLSGGTVTDMSGGTVTVTAHADSDAVLMVRWSNPTVVLRGRSSLLDYRNGRPVHHLADEGMVKVFGHDGSIVQMTEAEYAAKK